MDLIIDSKTSGFYLIIPKPVYCGSKKKPHCRSQAIIYDVASSHTLKIKLYQNNLQWQLSWRSCDFYSHPQYVHAKQFKSVYWSLHHFTTACFPRKQFHWITLFTQHVYVISPLEHITIPACLHTVFMVTVILNFPPHYLFASLDAMDCQRHKPQAFVL